MRKVLHVFKCIVLLVYLLALVLCCHSCIMTLFNNDLRTPTGSSDPAAPAPAPVSVPVEQPKDENSVALSSGVYPKDTDTPRRFGRRTSPEATAMRSFSPGPLPIPMSTFATP